MSRLVFRRRGSTAAAPTISGADDQDPGAFVKSSHSGSGDCVEVARRPDGEVLVRNSRFPDAGTLVFTDAEWRAFVAGVKDSEFDAL